MRRSISASEGIGITHGGGPTGAFDVMRAAYQLFDPTNKGYITLTLTLTHQGVHNPEPNFNPDPNPYTPDH